MNTRNAHTDQTIEDIAADSELTIRLSREADRAALRALAERDSSSLPDGLMLVAEQRGRLLAAVGLERTPATRAVIADPFLPTERAVGILLLRARQLRADSRTGGLRGLLRRWGRGAHPPARNLGPAPAPGLTRPSALL